MSKIKSLISYTIIIVFILVAISSCRKFLDINSDPDTPQFPDPSSVMPAMLSGIPRGTQYDGRFISRYIQNFVQSTATYAWDIHSHQNHPLGVSDAGGDIWRQCYFGLGGNLNYIIDQGIVKQQWDHVGAGYALKALMFQMCTDTYGEIIFKEAFAENKSTFAFDTQETVYRGVDSICRLALYYLSRNDQSASSTKLSVGDFVYSGDKVKWTKLVNGILAKNFHRITNKYGSYNADSVIYYAERSFTGVNDDFVIPFEATKNDDSNFFGTYRNNLSSFRQTTLIVGLLDGTILNDSTVSNPKLRDPRMKHMLSSSEDTTNGNGGYRGLEPGVGESRTLRSRTACPFGDSLYTNPSANRFDPTKGKYLFKDKVVSPVMTYAEIQFMIAEAAFRKQDFAKAHGAYTTGIKGHFDFINRSLFPKGNNPLFNGSAISASEITNYLNSKNVKKTPDALTISDIMLQKYIALWGWGFLETWVDMRRFHFTDIDVATGKPVYRGYVIPQALSADNGGKLATRIRPRYNSEFVWNNDVLERLGANQRNYHVKEMWFSQP